MQKKQRIFNISTRIQTPAGEEIINAEKVAAVLAKYRTIKKWAYCLHNKDVITDADIVKFCEKNKIVGKDKVEKIAQEMKGKPKPAHIHIVIQTNPAQDVNTIAKWFDIAANFIDIPKGRGAFLDCVQYLTHESDKEQSAGKHLYSDNDIHANFDFRSELDKRLAREIKLGDRADMRDMLRYEVLREGRTLRDVAENEPLAYQNDYPTLEHFRMKYLSDYAPMPEVRICIYLYGNGGVGKTTMARAIARALHPDLELDDDIYFVSGSEGAGLMGYDGQPVLILDDRRAGGLVREFGDRGSLFRLLDSHPVRSRQNVKYGSTCVISDTIIITGIEDFATFLNGLAGEYTDRFGNKNKAENKAQSWRRFPMIIPIRTDDFDILINKGFADGTPEYFQYLSLQRVKANLQQISNMCSGRVDMRKRVESDIVAPVVSEHKKLVEKQTKKNDKMSDEEILQYFRDRHYGECLGGTTIINVDPDAGPKTYDGK